MSEFKKTASPINAIEFKMIMLYCSNMFINRAKKQKGFSIVELLILLVIVSVVGVSAFIVFKGHNKQEQTSNSSEIKDTKSSSEFKIYNLGVENLDSMNYTTEATYSYTREGHKGFYIFGDELPGTPVRHNPNFEFASMKEDTKLISAIDGIVGFIKEQQENGDYEVFIMPSEDSDWVIGYDHVTDLKVKKGDKVSVGDLLGYPARQNNGLLRFEFQINKEDNSQDGIHICPVVLLDQSVKDSWEEQLKNAQDEWEKVSGLELYDTTKQDPVGCLQEELTPAEAQGY